MNLVDSSGWLEYLADGPNADFFASPLEAAEGVLVPAICVCEVFKRILQQRGEDAALQAAALMRQGAIVDLDFSLALSAAKIGHESKLPMADSIILATARAHGAILWTQDGDFEGFDGVRFVRKKPST
jgi:predicted nucleic acid-binding protein